MSVSICQKEHHDSDKPSDLINNQTPAGLDLYPVFCTANIPSNVCIASLFSLPLEVLSRYKKSLDT